MLQSMGLGRVRHNLATEKQQQHGSIKAIKQPHDLSGYSIVKGTLVSSFLKNNFFFQCYFDFEIVNYGPKFCFSTAPGFPFL